MLETQPLDAPISTVSSPHGSSLLVNAFADYILRSYINSHKKRTWPSTVDCIGDSAKNNIFGIFSDMKFKNIFIFIQFPFLLIHRHVKVIKYLIALPERLKEPIESLPA